MKLKKKPPRGRAPTEEAGAIESLYHDFLAALYDEADLPRARKLARRLEAIIRRDAAVADSIRGQEIAALIAELRGDHAEAIHCRESEIRKIFELHSISRDTPHWDYILRQYDYSDISDRLDLLALLHAENGDLERALSVLRESQRFCAAHRVAFDGQDILDEIQTKRKGGSVASGKKQSPSETAGPGGAPDR
jgi:hypothetical protein